jgi:hypothetical protein
LTSDASEPASGHDTETLVLAPNPAEAWVSLKYTHGKAIGSVQIIDMMGRIVLEEHNITASQHTLQTASLPMGVYQLRTNAAVTKLVIKG